ncbi:MAG TPA: alpha/beta hydrolase [Candidatus Angelobacter sp.]
MDLNEPVLDPQSQAFLKFVKDSGRPEMHMLSVDEARALFARGQAAVPVVKLPADIEKRTIPAGLKGSLLIYIVRPAGNKTTLPVVMFFHGGGWVLGDFETHERVVRDIVNGANVAVVFPEYTRAPDAHYPVANEEAYATTKWVAERGSEIGLDSSRIAVAGESAGGNMATVVCMMAKQRGGPKILAQVLFYPSAGGAPDFASRRQFAQGFYLTAETGRWFWRHYSGNNSIHTEPTACPLEASLEQLKGLPPALVITAECDILRDEGEAYARKLVRAGVPVTCTRYLGTLHGFNVASALATSSASRASLEQTCAMLREVFTAQAVKQTA